MRFDALPLSRSSVDRAADGRAGGGLDAALADPATRAVSVRGAHVLVDEHGLVLRDIASVGAAAPDETWLLLGRDDERAYVALCRPEGDVPPVGAAADTLVHRTRRAPSSDDPADAPGAVWASLRTVGATLGARDAGLATTAVALAAWHERHPRCPRCGGPTSVEQAGWVRRCTLDGSEHYPRTDPAVIMAVVDDRDRLLLGHAAAWAPGRYSTLAGFVEPGESLEAAVRREVAEEVGVDVGDVVYRGSQPWPFPASLMVGFVAHATTTDVRVDGDEVTQARWFTRDELGACLVAGEVVAPGPTSIARALIEDWWGAPLPEPADPALAWR